MTLTPEQAFAVRAQRDRDEIRHLWDRILESTSADADSSFLQRLEDLAHGLYGAGGTFGYDEISRLAGATELLLEGCRLGGYADWPARQSQLVELVPVLLNQLGKVGAVEG